MTTSPPPTKFGPIAPSQAKYASTRKWPGIAPPAAMFRPNPVQMKPVPPPAVDRAAGPVPSATAAVRRAGTPPPLALLHAKLVQPKSVSAPGLPQPIKAILPPPIARSAQPKRLQPPSPGRVIQRAEIEMQEFRSAVVTPNFPVGTYRLRHLATSTHFRVTVARTARPGGYNISVGVREEDGTNDAGVVTGDVVTASQTAHLNHISVEGIASRVPGLGAVLVYIFAAHIRTIANNIIVTTMAPTAAGFYEAIGFPVAATATAYFDQRRQGLNANNPQDAGIIAQWNERQQTLANAIANRGVGVGALPYAGAPERSPNDIIAANAGRVAGWRIIS